MSEAAIAAIGVALAAFCIWLTVRIINRGEAWAKRLLTSLIVVLVIYPATTGPLVCLDAHDLLPRWMNGPIDFFYAPLEILGNGSRTVRRAMIGYWKLWGYDGSPEIKNAIPG
jgi:hypothetical protein